jgi:hypothetical protein
MPVRFQVDGDFYDHPKTLDMSDAATALWTRAGSYSAAKLTDGFVPDAMLARLSRMSDEASQELVRRGLWKRAKGGFRFHQWKDRGNLTREQVENERSADRQRKRRARQSATQNTNPQVKPVIVRPDSGPESTGTPEGIRGLSVSVSESLPPTPKGGKRSTRSYAYDSDPKFVEFWDVYPSKNGKPNAFKAWQAAVERGADPDLIIKAAQVYRDDPRRNPQMTKYPQGWLSDERYNDQAEPQPAGGGWWEN